MSTIISPRSATTPTTPSRRKKSMFTHDEIESQLQALYLYSDLSTGTRDNDPDQLDHLGPIIRNIHLSKQQDAYLRHLNKFVTQKEAEIEAVCRDHYQDFIGSVDKLLNVRQGTISLKTHVVSLDSSLQSSGSALAKSRTALLDARKVGSNIDDTIETLQACLRVLDLTKKANERITSGKFYSALRSLDELQFVHLKPLLPFAAFAGYLGDALPSQKIRVREEVTKQLNTWLYEARERSQDVGRLAMEGMVVRNRRWKNRKERAKHHDHSALAMLVSVNTPIETAASERHEYNVLDHPDCRIDFGPLYLAIHIYDTLDAKEELQKSFKDDRRAQAHLMLSSVPSSSFSSEATVNLMESIVGFFIIESHLLQTTISFRDQTEVDNLWDEVSERVTKITREGIQATDDLDMLMSIKTTLLTFTQILEAHDYMIEPLQELLSILSLKYQKVLQTKFTKEFEQIVLEDDYQPMLVNDHDEFMKVIEVSFLPEKGAWSVDELSKQGFPTALPFSQVYPLCCIDIRNFVTRYHTFFEGLESISRDADDVLRQSLDYLLGEKISNYIYQRVTHTKNLSQLAQILVNAIFFQTACSALETLLVDLRLTPHGEQIKLECSPTFEMTMKFSEEKILSHINEKITDFFELSEYDWSQNDMIERGSSNHNNDSSSTYLLECMDYLETVMTNVLVLLPEELQRSSYVRAWVFIGFRLMSFLTDQEPSQISFGGLSVLANDIKFASAQVANLGVETLNEQFQELCQTVQLLQSHDIGSYLDVDYRKMKYNLVDPNKLPSILIKFLAHDHSTSSEIDRHRREDIQQVLDAVSQG